MSPLCTFADAVPTGSVALIHPETHFTDEKAGLLRRETYARLRRHWQFINELVLFDIDHHVSFGVHVYGASHEASFAQATSLYHPSTVERSLDHDGSGVEPGLKDDEGNWDLRPHASRIQHVDEDTLRTWHSILETDQVPVDRTRMVYTVNTSTAAVLDKLADAPRIGDLGLHFSAGWHETNDRSKGYLEVDWGTPESWDQVILQGPHLHVANPAYKTPNPTMLHNQDWTPVDLEALPADWIPATSYKPAADRATYDAAYTHWDGDPARNHYRVAWRRMAANTGERTLIPAVLPRRAAHVNGLFSMAATDSNPRTIALVAGSLSSMLADFAVRAVPKSEILRSAIDRLPLAEGEAIKDAIIERTLRLNCITAAYGEWWEACTGTPWTVDVPLRFQRDRRLAQLELDVLVAIALRVTADELCALYRTQFPVLYGYDRRSYIYDSNGRLPPTPVLSTWRAKGLNEGSFDLGELTASHPSSGIEYTYELPFSALDREAEMRAAYEAFSHLETT
ncbi:restriction endonuclease [Microbacterium hominis]|uniref:restriction endonuclease n=1 Tax=Microbacterium hominis TaxID=162426 RepID=UPI00168B6848|nr:restriction endonuclease [Microbacterium hominis]QOC24927.1 restriction endonuclease [Microbacterium hominis]